jgi:hypothetical protein
MLNTILINASINEDSLVGGGGGKKNTTRRLEKKGLE